LECQGEVEEKLKIPSVWNDDVQKAIKEKNDCFICLYLDRSAYYIEKYKMTKKATKRAVNEFEVGRMRTSTNG
jgi:hypothetical protein